MTALTNYRTALRQFRRVERIARLTGCMGWPIVQRMLRRLELRAARAKEAVHDERITEAYLSAVRRGNQS